jgi:hypothetical protein|tara:strand:+ start:3908 stop:6373 length:2466 start_codon:yes stop_codon:yes gene_type:complete
MISGLPDPNASKAKKGTKEYGMKYAKYIFGEANLDGFSFYSRRQRIIENELWAIGKQSVDHFKDLKDLGGDTSWQSLNLETSTPIPKFLNSFIGNVSNKTYNFVVEAMDNESLSEKDKEVRKRKRRRFIAKMAARLRASGINVDDKNPDETNEDIELDMELNWKLPLERGLEMSVRDVFTNCDKDELTRKMAFDVFANNATVTKKYFENGMEKVRHVKLANFTTSYCDRDDYSDAYYMAEVRQMTISQARSLYPGQLTDDEWLKVAENFSKRYGNGAFGISDYFNTASTWEYIEQYKVLVVDFQFKTANKYKWKDKTTRNGSEIVEEVGEDFDATEKRNTKVIEKDMVDVYEGVWIAESEHILSYGKKVNMRRKNTEDGLDGDTDMDFTIYKQNSFDMVNKSLTEIIRPYAEEIIIYNLKIMHIVMKARPPGAAIDITGLASMAQGLGDPNMATTDPMEIYAAYNQTGIFAYSSMRPDGSYISNSNPIQELDGGVSQSVQVLLGLRAAALQEIYNTTGFNQSADGSNQSKDALVGIEKIRANAFNVNMMPYTDSINKVMSMTANKVAESTKDRVSADPEFAKSLALKIGDDNVTYLKLARSASLAQLAVYVKYLPTAEDMIDFKEDLMKAEQNGIIDPADAMNAKELAKMSIKQAISYLKKAIKQKESKSQERAQANSAQQAELQANAAMSAEQSKQATLQMEWNLKTQYMITEKKLEAALMRDEAVEDRITKILDGEIKERLIEESNSPNENDKKVIEGVGKSDSRMIDLESTNRHKQANNNNKPSGGSGGLGVPKPAMAPRASVKPADDAQQGIQQSMR